MKPSKCKVCGSLFTKSRPLQKVCSPDCAMSLVLSMSDKNAKKKEREEKRIVRQKLDAMRKKPELTKIAQQAFNSFIRARDKGKPCISCGRPLSDEPNSKDAGHFRSVGSAPHMRFIESNCHAQCRHCNNHLGGNHVMYRIGLIERIGLAEVERIERDQDTRKYTKDELIELAKTYREKAKSVN